MTTLPASREVARLEAHHAAALILLGMPPTEARIDWPRPELAGVVVIDWGDEGLNRESAEKVLMAIILGGMTDGTSGWSDWPLDVDAVHARCRTDAEQAIRLAEYLKLDHAGWLHVIWKANQLDREPESAPSSSPSPTRSRSGRS